MSEFLGPLELIGDRWTIGDPNRKRRSHLVLTAEGVEHHKDGAAEPRAVIPWGRFMGLGVNATTRAWMATRGGGALELASTSAQIGGRSACSASATLRHPYENWSVNYTHHERAYTGSHVFLLGHLVGQVSDAKALHRLGDPQWLGAAVAKLAPFRVRWASTAVRHVREVVEGLGT
ncbi:MULTISPECIES: hypothetical protein [unclassified Streptomyces]|uniref:hypothetical protein n=1 Tax=unclassified Streptomyces TaxID=2593676 RepID=UPI002E2DAA91|nr:hypothetical protein [Streptomyces sp. NBC_00273]